MHPRGGARAALAFFCRISASLPLSPRPPSPPGKGGDFRLFLCKGLRPLHPRGGAGAALATGRKQGIRRGLGRFTRRVYSWCIIKIFPLSPRPPSRREGGDFRLFYARGFAPCIPGAEPARRWLFSAVSVLLCPYPPDPRSQSALPPWGRGRLYTLFRRGLTPPAPLRNKPARHWLRAGNRVPSGGLGSDGGAAGREETSGGGLGERWGSGGQGRGVRRGILSCFMPDSGIKVLERRGHGGGKLLSRSFPPPKHPGTPQTPYRSPRYRRRTEMSAGLTPLIREACPTVRGLWAASFWAASRRRPRMEE